MVFIPGSIPGTLLCDGTQEGQQPGSAIMQFDGIRKLINRYFLCTFSKIQLKYAKGQVHPFLGMPGDGLRSCSPFPHPTPSYRDVYQDERMRVKDWC